MVYPREYGLLTLSKFLAICALAGLFQSVAAQDATVEPTSAVVCTASSGDLAVGIQAIPDSTCENGGLGCYSTTCRFCKYSEMSQSAHLLACSGFGYDFPTLAPEPTTTTATTAAGNCAVSQGDYAVGIRAVVDASCANGGLGCYNDHCRFCKEVMTPQSAHLTDCSAFAAAVATEAPVVDTPAADTVAPAVDTVVNTVASAVDTVVPVVDTVAPVVDTVAPAIDTVTPAVDTVAPVVDTVAPVVDTVTPSVDTVTPVVDTVAPVVDTVAPVVDTVAPVVDTVAQVVDTVAPVVDTVAPVADTVAPVADTAAPVADTETPAVDTVVSVVDPSAVTLNPEVPSETTATPTTEEPAFNQTDYSGSQCTIDDSFKALGVDVVVDLGVTSVDADYYINGCRFCKRVDSIEFESFTFCALFPSYVDSDVVVIPQTPAPDVVFDTDAPAVVDTAAPVVDTPATEAPVDAAAVCTTPVSQSDAAAGIQIITDATCANGGLGCIDSSCRFCKVTTTAQSAHLDDCSKYNVTTTTEPIFNQADVGATACSIDGAYKSLGIDVAVDSSVTATDTDYYMDSCRFCKLFDSAESSTFAACTSLAGYGTTATPKCTQVVSTGDAAVGINITTDASCASGGVGCITNICRFCKVMSTPQSANFVSCSAIGSTSSTTTPSTTSAPTAATPSTAIPLTCSSTISDGDAAVGLDVVTDPTCGDGDVGCISSICRYCKRFSTAQSATYMNCSNVKVPDMSSITFVAILTVTTATTDAPVVTTSLTSINATTGTTVVTTTTAPATTAPVTTAPTITAPATTAPVTVVPATTAPATTAPAVTTQASATVAPTTAAPAATTCGTVSPGDSAVGLNIVFDSNCMTVGGLGCISGTSCKFCKLVDTPQSTSYAYCTGYPLATTSPALSALRVRASADEATASKTGVSAGLHRFFNNNAAAMYAVAAAACVGVIAVIAVVVVGAKRAVRRLRRGSSSESVDDSESGEGSVLTAVTEDSATVTGVSTEEEAGDV